LTTKPQKSGEFDANDAAAAHEGGRARSVGLAGLSRLEKLIAGDGHRAPAPVERWNPPYCGDIGLSIACDGTWAYRGSPINRPALVKLFASVLRRDDDGRHYLVTPAEKVDIAVEDAPLLSVEMDVIGEGAAHAQVLVMRTNLDDVVWVGNAHPLRFATGPNGGLKPYVLIRGRIEALATRALTYDLAALVVEDDAGRHGVWSGGAFFAIPQSQTP
jgi:hypothetical protein